MIGDRQATKSNYDRISRFYDVVEGPFEREARERGLSLLDVREGERVLEIGYGTGEALAEIAGAVGPTGWVTGLDLSTGMRSVTAKRLREAGLMSRVDLVRGDAAALPFEDDSFDAIFMSFFLELMPEPDISIVLRECRRVLRADGRLGIVALTTVEEERPLMMRLYEWGHRRFPAFLDCRPIPVVEYVREAGFDIAEAEQIDMWGIPVAVVLARKMG